ncbi:hypothetical protein [Capybara microvirus Cap1_SP_128]|nr:hypothetical protein [Capybara microvirus Cap1_SP_128]
MIVNTVFTRGEFKPTKYGDKERVVYKRDDSDGYPKLVEIEKIDIQEEMNSIRITSIPDMVASALRSGDINFFESGDMIYGDVSKIKDLESAIDFSKNLNNDIGNIKDQMSKVQQNNDGKGQSDDIGSASSVTSNNGGDQ